MRRAALLSGLATAVFAASLALAADPQSPPPPSLELQPMPSQVFSPFGPAYDPLKDPPVEPKEKGAGISSATLVASGPAEIEELTKAGFTGQLPFVVVLDIVVAAGSTTLPLSPATVTARPEKGDAIPLLALCTPTNEIEDSIWRPLDAGLASWHVAAGGKSWYCGGRTARMTIRFRQGGMRLVNDSAKEWKGPLVLLFRAPAETPREVALPGATVKLPEPKDAAAAAH